MRAINLVKLLFRLNGGNNKNLIIEKISVISFSHIFTEKIKVHSSILN
jgi:hypothetical protein